MNNSSTNQTTMNKNRLMLIIAIVVFVISATLLIVAGVISGNNNNSSASGSSSSSSESTITEGDETGVYYFSVDGDEYVITMNSGDKFTYVGAEVNKSGTYAVDGNAITFTFNKKEDGQMTATLNGETLTVTYGESEMRFLKKVSYTVSFDTKGAEQIDGITVLNGKTVELPAAPARNGYVFGGWYSDEACTTAYNPTSVVTSDITLYAYWVEVIPGKAEYEITFDFNDGVTASTKVSTTGGKLLFVATPEREDYTFAGWWTSDYEDVNKLTAKYVDGTIFDEDTTLYAMWTEATTGTKLAAPAVNVDASGLSWTGVAGASDYAITVAGPKGFKTIDETVGSTSKAIDFANAPAGDYVITVVANASDASNNSNVVTRYYKNKVLARVSDFNVIDPSTLIFTPVENATGYYITVYCGNSGHSHTNYYLGTSNYFNFANCAMTEDGITFIVTAVANGYAASTSAKYVYYRNLDAVNLYFDEATQTFVWDRVANAMGYVVNVTCGNHTHEAVTVTGNEYSIAECAGCEGGILFSVYPVTNGYNSPEATTYIYNKDNLPTPTNIRIVETELVWDAVEGATSYSLKVGNTVISDIEATTYDIVTALKWVEGNNYAISIKANGDKDSVWSKDVDMLYYAMYTGLDYEAGAVTWRPVIGAVKYEVVVNDIAVANITDGSTSYAVTFDRAGENTVKVRFVDANDTVSAWASIVINTYMVEFDTRGGAAIDPIYRAVGEALGELPTTTKAGYEFQGWYNSVNGPESNGAEYTATDIFTANNDIVIYAYWKSNTYRAIYSAGENGLWPDDVVPETWVEYRSDDYVLAVPMVKNTKYVFVGWYTAANGTGTRLTDDTGAAMTTWIYSADTEVFAYYTEVFKFNLLSDLTYSVKRGPNINLVTSVTVPTHYEGVPVTVVDGYAFDNCYYLRVINIPDSIQIVETSTAFYGCRRLTDVNVYPVEGNHEKFYFSVDGVLFRNNTVTGTVEFALFPVAKEGSYTIPDGIQSIPYKVFANSKITDITIPSSVTMIDDSAFFECLQLTAVNFLPAPVGESALGLQIAENAFMNCTALTCVNFPARTSYLAVDSDTNEMTIFSGCTALRELNMEDGNTIYASIDGVLTNVDKNTLVYCPAGRRGVYEIPGSITTVADRAFSNCVNLTGLEVHSNVTQIGDYAFAGCTNISYVTFKGRAMNALTIGDYAFYGDVDIKTITFAEGSKVEEIGDYAFAGCTALRAVVVPASLKVLGDYVFADCSSIGLVEFEENGQNLQFGEGTFYNCKSLTEVQLPSTISELPLGVFAGCDNIKGIYVDDNNKHFCDVEGVVYSYDMTELYFYSKRNGNHDIPDTVKKIHAGVYQGNSYITSVTLPAVLEYLGNSAFEDCNNLKTVTFEEGTADLYLGNRAFEGCYLIETFTIPTRATEIGDYFLANAVSLRTVNMHNNITRIGDYAFAYTAINPSELPTSLVEIGDYAFARTLISRVEIAETLNILGKYAFEGCGSLTEVVMPENSTLTAIPDGVFKGTSLTSFFVPKTVTQIGAFAFDSVASLTSVEFEDGGEEDLIIGTYLEYDEDDAMYICEYESFSFAQTGLTSIDLPDRLTIIGEGAFYFCQSLTEVNISENSRLKVFGGYSFASTGITSIYIPNTVHDISEYTHGIGYGAFCYAENLSTVTFATGGTETMSLAYYSFDGTAVEELNFPANIAFATPSWAEDYNWLTGALGYNLKRLTIAEGEGGLYKCINNVLYTADMSTICYMTPGYEGALVIPKEVTSISSNSIRGNITDVSFEEGSQIKIIGDNAFANARYITSLTLPEGLEEVGRSAFASNNVKSLHIPSTVKKIGSYAFGFSGLVSLTFAENSQLEVIADYAFQGVGNSTAGETDPSKRLTSITIPKSVTAIGTSAFNGAKTLEHIYFEEGSELTEIGGYAFTGTNIKEIVLPAKLEKLGNESMSACIEKVTLSEKIQDISTCFYLYRGTGNRQTPNKTLKEVIVPENSTYLKNGTKVVDGVEVPDYSVVYSLDGTHLTYFAPAADATGFVIPDSVSVIDKNAFHYNTTLTSIEIPANVIEICEAAFKNTEMKALTFASRTLGLSIGDHAFWGNEIVGEILLPAQVTSVGAYCFAGDWKSGTTSAPTDGDDDGTTRSSITGIKIGNDGEISLLKSIGNYAFYYTNLASFVIPKGVETIGDGAFYGLSTLKSFSFEPGNKSIVRIPYRFIASCTYVTSIEIPESVTAIGQSAFEGCTRLASVKLPEYLTKIEKQAFYKCSALTSINIPANVGSIADYAFASCTQLATVTLNEGLESIGNYVFQSCSKLTGIVIPNTVTSMGTYVFNGCSKLANVTLSNKLSAIGNYAFQNCTSLTSIEIPGSVESIGNYAFSGCKVLADVRLNEGVEKLGNYAFQNCKALKELLVPVSFMTLGLNPFSGCTAFNGMTIAEGNDYFRNVDGILYNYEMTRIITFPSSYEGEYIIPDTVTEVASGTFSGTAITKVVISNGMTEIPSNAFYGCERLTEVVFHDGITYIGDSAFAECYDLSKIYTKVNGVLENRLPDGLREIGESSFYCTKLKSVTIGNLVTEIRPYAFSENSNLAEVIFVEGGREEMHIGEGAFSTTALEAIEIPFRVRTPDNSNGEYLHGIGEYAFAYNENLTSVTFEKTGDSSLLMPQLTIGKYAFSDCTSLEAIEFPKHVGDYYYRYEDGDSWYNEFMYAFSEGAFMNCSALESVTFEENLANTYTFGGSVFENCTSLVEFEFPAKTLGFGSRFFKNTAIKTMVLPDLQNDWYSETYQMFMDCRSLVSVELSDSINVQTRMFANCVSLASIKIRGKESEAKINFTSATKYIGTETFYNCSSLTGDVVIPETIKQIYQGAFSGCTGINSITIPVTVTSLDTDQTMSPYPVHEGRIFNGWTAEQTIYVGFKADELPVVTDQWNGWRETWLDGCSATVVYAE